MTTAAAPELRRRAAVFALVIAACGLGIAGGVRHALQRAAAQAAAAAGVVTVPIRPGDALPGPGGRPVVLVRHTGLGADYGRLGLAAADDPDGARRVAPLDCERVYAAAGAGLCLTARRGAVTTYEAVLFDEHLAVRRRFALPGPPSRARVSPDGRRAAFTTFIVGHAYASPGFTTRTTVIDARSGDVLVADLEAWPVVRDGQPFQAADFNFWGVTFDRDGEHFYVTLGTGGATYLVEGRLAQPGLRVVARDVECPSLSPDGRRIAFKRRDAAAPAGRIAWRIAVMDLATQAVRLVRGETRSVDDQVEWHGNGELLYGLEDADPTHAGEVDVWAVGVDGDAPARRLLRFASSPAVLGAGAR